MLHNIIAIRFGGQTPPCHGFKMKHYHIECNYGYDNCYKCRFLKDCFPITHERKMEAIDKRWKDKYGDEF